MKIKHFYLLPIVVLFLFSSCVKNELGELPSISFTYSNNVDTVPVAVSFSASTMNTETVSWDFGDGQSGIGTSITHIYTSQGLYKVTATATSQEGIISKQMKSVNVSPYTQIAISQIIVSVPTPTSFYSRIYSSSDSLLKQTNYVFTSISANDTLLPPVLITDFERPFKVKIMNFGTTISAFEFSPEDYFEATIPFSSTLSKSDAMGRTVLLYISWN